MNTNPANVLAGSHLYHSGYRTAVTSWPSSICLSGVVDTHHVPDIWEQQPIPQPPSSPWTQFTPPPCRSEATGLMGTTYLNPAPYQIVDTNRCLRNENILLLLTLTLAYMDLHLCPRWNTQLLCVCVGVNACGCPRLLTGAWNNQPWHSWYLSYWCVCVFGWRGAKSQLRVWNRGTGCCEDSWEVDDAICARWIFGMKSESLAKGESGEGQMKSNQSQSKKLDGSRWW